MVDHILKKDKKSKVKLNYDIELIPIETTDGRAWIASYPALQGVMGGGKTIKEAILVLEEEALEMIEFLKSEGEEMPKQNNNKEEL